MGTFSVALAGCEPCCSSTGYSVENGTPYWLMKNSWGADWGDNISFEMEMGKNMCAPAVCENSRLLKKHLMEEHQRAIEFERWHFAELQHHQMCVGNYSVEDLKLSSEGNSEQQEFPSAGGFTYMLDVGNSGSTSEDETRHVKTNHCDQER